MVCTLKRDPVVCRQGNEETCKGCWAFATTAKEKSTKPTKGQIDFEGNVAK